MDVTIRQLQTFIAVCRTMNFTRAAEELHISQSRLSRIIAELERSLRTPLIERSTRSLALTPAGEELLLTASTVVKDFEAMLLNFDSYLGGSRGRLDIVTLPSLAASLLPAAITNFRSTHREIDISVEDLLSSDSLQSLVDGKADVGIIGTGYVSAGEKPVPTISEKQFDIYPLINDRFLVIFPAGHHFERREAVSWNELSLEKVIAFSAGASVQKITEIGMVLAGAQYMPHMRAGNLLAVGGVVAAGLGVSTVPALVKPLLERLNVGFCPMIEPELYRQVGLVRNAQKRPSPPAAAFWNEMTTANLLPTDLPYGAIPSGTGLMP